MNSLQEVTICERYGDDLRVVAHGHNSLTRRGANYLIASASASNAIFGSSGSLTYDPGVSSPTFNCFGNMYISSANAPLADYTVAGALQPTAPATVLMVFQPGAAGITVSQTMSWDGATKTVTRTVTVTVGAGYATGTWGSVGWCYNANGEYVGAHFVMPAPYTKAAGSEAVITYKFKQVVTA